MSQGEARRMAFKSGKLSEERALVNYKSLWSASRDKA